VTDRQTDKNRKTAHFRRLIEFGDKCRMGWRSFWSRLRLSHCHFQWPWPLTPSDKTITRHLFKV